MRYAVIRDGVVESVHEWDGRSEWVTPVGTRLRGPLDGPCEAGWRVVGDDLLPPPTLDEIRTAALTEVAWLAAVRAEEPATVPGYDHPLGVGADSQRDWASLLTATTTCEQVGGDPDVILYPQPFAARDGGYVVLRTAAEARALYLTLFALGGARRRAADAAVVAIRAASTVEEIGAIVDAYRGAG